MARKKTILLVEDQAPVREALQRLLVHENYSVVSTTNGRDALEQVSKKPVDLVLMDVNIPGETVGLTFQSLRTARPHLPVIFMTGGPHGPKNGAFALSLWMEKPLDLPLLLQSIKDLLAEPFKPTSPTKKEVTVN